MEKVISYEPLLPAQLRAITTALGLGAVIARIADADVLKGAGVIGPTKKCLWTKDGRRITIEHSHGTTVASCSKEKDPECPT